MTDKFYKPLNHKIFDIPLIIYVAKEIEGFDRNKKNSVEDYLESVYKVNAELLNKGSYHIIIVWSLDGNKMADIWVNDMNNFEDTGPVIDCFVFKETERFVTTGQAAGDEMIVLGREEELRRKINNLDEYVDRSKYLPDFPEYMQLLEEFYL